MTKEKIILVIRDGWGHRDDCTDNAICNSPTPNTDKLMREYPNVLIDAAGKAVGLPDGYQGNSEVGHVTIGSGRIILQSLERINHEIENEKFFTNEKFLLAINNCKKNNSRLHIMGLVQSEGVHAHEQHLYAILKICRQQNFEDILVHVITDGRDAPVTNSIKHVQSLLDKMKELGVGSIASVCGRYYAMDRNEKWERTEKSYAMVFDTVTENKFDDPMEYIRKSYDLDQTDEFIKPACKKDFGGVCEGDSFIFFNFRTDRTRQFTRAAVEKDFSGFEREKRGIVFVAMTQYYKPMDCLVAYEDHGLENLLGEVISDHGLKQLRISETEKYAHVTFFFNGQVEEPYRGEDRILIPSPNVATYDLKPEMSVYDITEKLCAQISADIYDLIVVNLVNGDMVGHTGLLEAIGKAVTAVDDCVEKIVKCGLEKDYTLLVFADHGNAEDQRPEWRTSHTTNQVPFILISNRQDLQNCKLKNGMGLKDIAPTVLDIFDIKAPNEFTGDTIIDH